MIYFQKAVLPARVRSLVLTMEDGTFTVLVNADLAPDQAENAAVHEVEHILDLDFEKLDVEEIEAIAHRKGGLHEETGIILSRLMSDGSSS